MEKRTAWFLVGIVLITFILRLTVAFSIGGLTYQSYFHIRQVDTIVESGHPMWYDPFSYGGREIRFLPLYHYMVALPAFFIDTVDAAKLVTNFIYALIPLFVFFIAHAITQDDESSLVAGVVSALLPVLFTPNTVGPESLYFVLVLVCIYMFMLCEKPNYLYYYGLFFFLLMFTSSLAILLVLGFIVYLALTAIEGKKVKREQTDLIIFSFFFYIWLALVLFKDHFLLRGISFVFQNVPSESIANYFPSLSIASAILLIGIIPFLAGTYVVYKSLFELKQRRLMLLISLAISTTILAWLRFIPFTISLSFFGLTLSILFAVFYRDVVLFVKKTKIASRETGFKYVLIGIVVISTLPLSISAATNQDVPSQEEITAFHWLSQNTDKGATILALVEEGHLVSYVGERKNVMDENYVLADDVDLRFNDMQKIFNTRFQSIALELLEKYNVSYIVITPRATKYYEQHDLAYRTPECFEKVYKVETRIYKVTCLLRSR